MLGNDVMMAANSRPEWWCHNRSKTGSYWENHLLRAITVQVTFGTLERRFPSRQPLRLEKVFSDPTCDSTIKTCNVLHMCVFFLLKCVCVCEWASVCARSGGTSLVFAVRLGNTKRFMDEMHIGSSCLYPGCFHIGLCRLSGIRKSSLKANSRYLPS